jgi:hypothetical protein
LSGNKYCNNDGLDCFTLRVRNDGDVRRVIAKAQPEAIQTTGDLIFTFNVLKKEYNIILKSKLI